MGSTRLPGKSLMPLVGKPLLWHILQRVKRAAEVDRLVLAIPFEDEMSRLLEVGYECGVHCHVEMEAKTWDLVKRYRKAAEYVGADVVVRVCADNPVIQPSSIDRLVRAYRYMPAVFLSNTLELIEWKSREWIIDGLGAEILSTSRLKWLDHYLEPEDPRREHVHQTFIDFGIRDYLDPEITSKADHVLDVNTPDQFAAMRKIYEHCFPRHALFSIDHILEHLHG